jgi:aryl-phospho-beta-D-glucosidase BglC (GH1 family)
MFAVLALHQQLISKRKRFHEKYFRTLKLKALSANSHLRRASLTFAPRRSGIFNLIDERDSAAVVVSRHSHAAPCAARLRWLALHPMDLEAVMTHSPALAHETAASAQPLRWIASLVALGTCCLIAVPDALAQTASCQVTYTKAWEGGNGYGANLEIRNNGPAINGWTMTFAFRNGERIQNGWPVTFAQPVGSAQVTVSSNADWNQRIPTGTSIAVGFNGTFATANGPPATFTLNGTTCGGPPPVNPPPSATLTSPNSGQVFPVGSSVPLAASASDPGGGITKVEFRVDGNLVNSDTSSPYAYAATGLASGVHTAQAVAFDNGTPVASGSSAVVSFTIGTANPNPNPGAVFRVDATGKITKNGAAFPVHCGSWFGLEGRHEPPNDPVNPNGAPMEQYLGNPFYANGGAGTGRTLEQTMAEIAGMGINMVRLPVVPQTLNANDPQGTGSVLKNHSSVRVANSRLALEQFIVAADRHNIEIMLDVHSCSNYVGWRKGRLDARPPWTDADRDNYNFKRENYSCAASGNPSTVTTTHPYGEAAWLDNLRTLAGMGQQLGVDNIIGIDIYNEPHDYTWAEWKRLTEAAYQAINAVNPNTLLFVQGIGTNANGQDGTPATTTAVPHGAVASNPNWGENLFEAGTNPINIPKERLVFSPHTYGPSVFVQRMFMDPAQAQCTGLEGDAAGDADCNIVINPTLLRAGWEEHFGYLRDQGYAVVVGEFGGNLDWPRGQANLRDRNRWGHITAPVDAQWQDAFVGYMVENKIDGCYWSINPESGDTAGWYGHEFDPISDQGWGIWRTFDQRKTNLLNRLWGN